MSDTREILRRGLGDFAPDPDGYERVLRRLDRKRRNQRIAATVVAAAIVVTGAIAFLSTLRTEPPPLDEVEVPVPATNTRPVFQRTATVGGLTVTSPSDWYLVDYWGAWDPEDPTALDAATFPLFEVTNFDPGLSMPVCDEGSETSTRLPADGVAILVTVGNDGSDVADLCGGSIETSSTGTVGGHPYRAVMTVGPDVTEEDRTLAMEIWASMEWTDFTFYLRGRDPHYVIDGWQEGSATSLVEARRSEGDVEVSFVTVENDGVAYDSVAAVDVPRPNAIAGESFGVVTEEAARVEYHRSGVDAPFVARLVDLPPSLAAGVDAWVVEPRPTGGPSEVVAIGADGVVLGSNIPPLVDTVQVGTVDAFGATWTVKRSTAADGYWGATCVEPAGSGSTLSPCERGWGGGMLVQTFDGPDPAVFVTQYVGDIVGAIDLHADDGRVFHAVMLPDGPGAFVAVLALEGEGRGNFVYSLTDGRTDEGRRPEAHVAWPDLGQVVGEGSFPPPT